MVHHLILALLVIAGSTSADMPENWATSPEAAFLTNAERKAWQSLTSSEAREEFIQGYWLRRDPTPETPDNEFQELVFQRIERADTLFGTRTATGSRTERGLAFIILGPPAVIQQTTAPLDMSLERGAGNSLHLKRSALATTSWHLWIYDKEHTEALIKALRISSLELPFVVESAGADQMQDHGRFHHIREKIAQQSITNASPER